MSIAIMITGTALGIAFPGAKTPASAPTAVTVPRQASEPVAREARDATYENGWYRDVRIPLWLSEGADRATLVATLQRISSAKGVRLVPDHKDTITKFGPGNWTFEFVVTGDEAFAAAELSEKRGDDASALRGFMAASLYYTIASYPHLRDGPSRIARTKAFDAYRRGGRHFAPPLETWDVTVDGVTIPALVHLPPDMKGPVPVVLTTGGMDVLSTEFFTLYPEMAKRGWAMITFDIPGTGNDAIFGPNSDKHHAAVLDRVRKDPRFDPNRIGVFSDSLGGHSATRLAITRQKDLAAVVASCGLIHAAYAFELAGKPFADRLPAWTADYRAGKLSPATVAAINKALGSTPQAHVQKGNFQFDVFADRIRGQRDSLLDLLSKSWPISLVEQGLVGHGIATTTPILVTNTHVDPIVPKSDSLLSVDASEHGTLMLIGKAHGHCVSAEEGTQPVMEWLDRYLR